MGKRLLLKCLLLLITTTTIANTTPPPPAQDVFAFKASLVNPNAFVLEWTVKPGFFIYRDRIQLLNPTEEHFHLADTHFPKALVKINPQGEQVRIYRDTLTLPVSVLGNHAGESLFTVRFQGCSDDGFCYPPETTQVKLGFNDKQALIAVAVEQTPHQPQTTAPNDSDSLKQLFLTNNWALICLSFFGFGLLLSFTPCVLPMIPVLSGIILGQGKQLSMRKAFLLSLSYTFSMACTYAFVGAIVALMGNNLQIAMQSTWIVTTFSMVFIVLALSMFGFYDLQLPAAWHHKLTKFSHSQAGGYYLGTAIMGCLSTLILSPCVTAPLIGALGYIAHTGDITRGSIALFCLGTGMGIPLLLIGTSAGKWVPKTGNWMHTIKAFFGLMLLAVAIHLLSRVLPALFIMGLWASLLIFTGIYTGALTHAESNQAKFRQGVGIITLIYGILILIGASQGNHDPLRPLEHPALSSTSSPSTHPTFTTLAAVKQALLNARGKGVIIDFYADWCATCKHIESTTLKNPAVQNVLGQVEWIKVDVTDNNNNSRELLHYFNVVAPPTFIVYNQNGTELKSLRLVGAVSPNMLLNVLAHINTKVLP